MENKNLYIRIGSYIPILFYNIQKEIKSIKKIYSNGNLDYYIYSDIIKNERLNILIGIYNKDNNLYYFDERIIEESINNSRKELTIREYTQYIEDIDFHPNDFKLLELADFNNLIAIKRHSNQLIKSLYLKKG